MGKLNYVKQLIFVVFYIPDCPSQTEYRTLIERNGGRLTD